MNMSENDGGEDEEEEEEGYLYTGLPKGKREFITVRIRFSDLTGP